MDVEYIGSTYDGHNENEVCNGVYTVCPKHSCVEVSCNLKCDAHTCTPKNYVKNTGVYDDDDDDDEEDEGDEI